MKTKLILAISLLLSFALTACDLVEGPKVDPSGFTGSANKVLLEDFTAHNCGYCPRGHAIAQDLKQTYGENVVVVAIHAGLLSNTFPALGLNYDFRTPIGNELEAYYDIDQQTGLPIGLIDRKLWDGSPLVDKLNWGTNVPAVLAEPAKMKMQVSSIYSASDRSLQVNAKLEYYTTGNANHQIVVWITEDSIVAPQINYDSTLNNFQAHYIHNHVLRGSITPGTWGVPVKGNTIVLGEKFDLTFEGILAANWVPEHCHVVVYVHDNATKEILQVEEVKLKE